MNADDSTGTRLGQIMDESMRLARAAMMAVIAYIGGLTVVGVIVDQMTDFAAGNLLFAVTSLALGFYLTMQLLQTGGLAPDGLRAKFGGYFGTSLLSGLAMIAGLLLLVIPGVVLFVRWSPVYGYVMAEGLGVSAGLRKAWDTTAPHFWPLLLAFMPPVALNLAAGGAYIFGTEETGLVPLPFAIIANGAMAIAGAGITVIGIAAYALGRDRSADMAEVFA